MAQQILVQRKDSSVTGALVDLVRKSNKIEARFHALWALEGIGTLESDLVKEQMKDSNPRMRIMALWVSESLYKAGDKSFDKIYLDMMHDPDILIMDEPTDGLDPVGRSQIRTVIEELRDRGKTIFLNSNILQEVEMVCDRVAILAKGLLRGLGTTEELTSQFRKTMVMKVTFELEASK